MVEKPTPIETEVIKYLALKPKENTQRIQRGIGLEDKNYPTVRKAIKRLEKKSIIKHSKGESEKKVSIKFYQLTPHGVFLALGIGSDSDLIKILDKNKNESEDLFLLKQYTAFLTVPTAIKILRNAGKFALSHQDLVASKEIVGAIIMNVLIGVASFSEEEMKEIAKATAKVNNIKTQIKIMFDSVKEVFEESEKFYKKNK
jgi:DNA-binding PadR family transcriptional regulator